MRQSLDGSVPERSVTLLELASKYDELEGRVDALTAYLSTTSTTATSTTTTSTTTTSGTTTTTTTYIPAACFGIMEAAGFGASICRYCRLTPAVAGLYPVVRLEDAIVGRTLLTLGCPFWGMNPFFCLTVRAHSNLTTLKVRDPDSNSGLP
jgi:hypothetical protein